MIKPRDYQERQIKLGVDFFNSKEKLKPSIIVDPVAAGKSIIIGGIANELVEPTLILQPSKELLEQNYNKLISFGGEATIYSASLKQKELSHLTYGTLGSIRKLGREFRDFGIKNVIIDECHMGYSPETTSTFRIFMKELNPKKVLGFTATPIRLKTYGGISDNWSQLNFITKGSPKYFSNILDVLPISYMVENKYWSELLYETYDFDEGTLTLNSTGAEFTEHSIKQAIAEQGINNSIYIRIKNLLKEGRKRILVFMDSVETAQKMASLFDSAACVYGSMDNKERARIVDAFKSGELQIVTNFGTLTTGFDYPELDTIIVGRPTNSLALYYQIVGRGTRIHPDKENCLIIDFCNNVKRFGKLEDLEFDYIEGYGWGLFSKEILLSDTPMGGKIKTKQDLIINIEKEKEKLEDITVWFGAHKGKKVSQLPLHYINWALKEWDFNGSGDLLLMKVQMQKRVG